MATKGFAAVYRKEISNDALDILTEAAKGVGVTITTVKPAKSNVTEVTMVNDHTDLIADLLNLLNDTDELYRITVASTSDQAGELIQRARKAVGRI